MKVNIGYLQKFIAVNQTASELKEIFASIGLGVEEISRYRGKVIFEMEITANRPDCLSHYGIARDLHSRLPELKFSPISISERNLGNNKSEPLKITIQEKRDCGRYTGCLIRNLKVGESSAEIKELLESCGSRPINNIVDVSNLIIMALGHPIHLFDLDKLDGNEVQVRRARKGESILLLDGREIELEPDFLVIADRHHPVALAGIMGGELSGVTKETRNILIESAYFNPMVIRRAARKLGIQSDASFRFERGADILLTPMAMGLALDMIEKTQDGELSITGYKDRFPAGFVPKTVELGKTYPSVYSGIEIKAEISEQILPDLGFKLTDKGDRWSVEVPSFRVDIYGKQDLVEEIIRIHGYDRLQSSIPLTSNTVFQIDRERELIQKTRNHLTSIGFFEVINYTFNSPEEYAFFGPVEKAVEICNPLGLDFSLLRKSLIPGLLGNAVLNFNYSVPGVSLFEVGNHFVREADAIQEKVTLGILGSGEYQKYGWKNREGQAYDFFIFKSLIASLFARLSINLRMEKGQLPFLDPECSFRIYATEKEIGYLGSLKKEIQEWYKIGKPVFVSEMLISEILEIPRENSFEMWSNMPSYRRDFSFLMNRNQKYEDLENAIQILKPETLLEYTLFDHFQGKGIPPDKISLSMGFIYHDDRKTLTTEEINEMHQNFINRLIKKMNLVQR